MGRYHPVRAVHRSPPAGVKSSLTLSKPFIRREALFYMQHLDRLQRRMVIDFVKEAIEEEKFWNRQMAEHAQFIRHLLDPTETGLIVKAGILPDSLIHLSKKYREQHKIKQLDG